MVRRIDERILEERTHEIGDAFFDAVERSRPNMLQAEWWNERLMEQWMQDEWLKVQAFRFIDALPMLRDATDVARHLREYLVHPSHEPHKNGHAARPRWDDTSGLARRNDWLRNVVSRSIRMTRPDGWLGRALAGFARSASVRMAGTFIAAENLEEAEKAVRVLRDHRLAFTMDVLGEAALSEVEAEHYQNTYLKLIHGLSQHAESWHDEPLIDRADGVRIPRVNVSVKLTSIYSQLDAIDPERSCRMVKERVRPLLRAGMEHGAHIHIDMEHYAIKNLTLRICRELLCEDEFRDYPHFGIVLQAYLRDGDRDLADTIEWVKQRGAPIWIRLVKGAYWDTETVLADQGHAPWPVWEQKWMSDACYERMTRVMLQNHEHIRSAFASHNIRSLSYAMALRELLGVPGEAFELQMLHGMGNPLKRAAVAMNQRCRVYTPYGDLLPGMAYLIRRLLENTSNESFLRASDDPSRPRSLLLENPIRTGQRTPPRVRPLVIRYEFGEPLMDPFENVPNTGFSNEDNQARMVAAIAKVRENAGVEIPLVIGGQHVTTAELRETHNPAKPAEVLARVAQAGAARIEQAVEAAGKAYKSWRLMPANDRAEVLFETANRMQQQRFGLAATIVLECGKPWREADAEVSEAIDFCNYYGKEMIRIADNVRRRDVPGETNEYSYSPRGVVAVLSPWNFPLAIVTGMTAAAIVTGNTAVIKPSRQASLTAYRLVELLEQSGLPAGVVNFVPGTGAEIGDQLVRHPEVATIAFTGSREVGCGINATAAASPARGPGLKTVIAEMGGKGAIIVDADADLDESIKAVVASAFGYAGQKGAAGSRCIVLEPMHDRLLERLVEATRSIQVGPAEEPGTVVPPVIDEAAATAVREYIQIGKQEARCVLEVDVAPLVQRTGGHFVGPTIFTDVPPDARIAREEIFGPVLSIIKARDMDHAIEIFNSADYALTGGIFSRSPANLDRAAAECECGVFYVNRKITGAMVDRQPFGGVKMSGPGPRAGGPDYLIQFMQTRTVTENTLRRGFAPSEEVAEAVS